MQTLADALKLHGNDLNAKYSNTILYNVMEKQWCWVREVGGRYCTYYKYNHPEINEFSVPALNYKNFLLTHPRSGYYNNNLAKQAFIFQRFPIRGQKKGTEPDKNCSLFSPFWNKLPNGIKAELIPIIDFGEGYTKYLYTFNQTDAYYHFNAALEKVLTGEYLSCAFSNVFAIAPSFYTDDYCCLYLDNEIGRLDIPNQRITLHQKEVKQELLDLFKRASIRWLVE